MIHKLPVLVLFTITLLHLSTASRTYVKNNCICTRRTVQPTITSTPDAIEPSRSPGPSIITLSTALFPSPTAEPTETPEVSPSPSAVPSTQSIRPSPADKPSGKKIYKFKNKIVYIGQRPCKLVCRRAVCRYCCQLLIRRIRSVRVCRREVTGVRCRTVRKVIRVPRFGSCVSQQKSIRLDRLYRSRSALRKGHRARRGSGPVKRAW